MYFRRNYQPNYSSRDYYTDTAALYRYWSSLRARNRIRRKHLHRYHRSNFNPARNDPLLFFALGYILGSSDSDPVERIVNGSQPKGPGGSGPGENPRPFEIRYTQSTCFNGPLDTSILTDNYRPGRFFERVSIPGLPQRI